MKNMTEIYCKKCWDIWDVHIIATNKRKKLLGKGFVYYAGLMQEKKKTALR